MPTHPTDRPHYLVHASVAVRDDRGRLLLVQEQKPSNYGKWNLPGGHVDHGESLAPAAQRELLEETRLRLPMQSLLGIYPFAQSVRFVFNARANGIEPQPGDEILAVRWVDLDWVLNADDAELVSADNLKTITRHLQQDAAYPLTLLHPVQS